MLSGRLIRRAPPHIERKDLEQVGLIALLRAKETWTGKTKFITYAYKRIRGDMIEELRKGSLGPRGKPWFREGQEVIDAVLDFPSEDFAERCVINLPERELLAISFRVMGYTYAEIGEKMEVSEATAYAWVQKAVETLKRMNLQ